MARIFSWRYYEDRGRAVGAFAKGGTENSYFRQIDDLILNGVP